MELEESPKNKHRNTEEYLIRSIINHEARIRNKSAKLYEQVHHICLELSCRFIISKIADGTYDVLMSINGDPLTQYYRLTRFYPQQI